MSFEIMDPLTVNKSVEIIEFHYEKGDFDVSTFWALQAFGFLLMRLWERSCLGEHSSGIFHSHRKFSFLWFLSRIEFFFIISFSWCIFKIFIVIDFAEYHLEYRFLTYCQGSIFILHKMSFPISFICFP